MLLVPVFFIIKNNINSRTLTLINLIFEFYKSIDLTRTVFYYKEGQKQCFWKVQG